jgi:hypothetical protein
MRPETQRDIPYSYFRLARRDADANVHFPPTNGHERRPGAILKAALLRERACATKDGNQAASEA